MPKVTATEASRNFSAILDDVEHRGASYTVERHGRVVARIAPEAAAPNGAAVIEALRQFQGSMGEEWASEIVAARAFLRDDSLDHVEPE